MGTLIKQHEKWMTREEFNNLDLSQVPVGTVINVVDTEYHRWKIEVDTGVSIFGKFTYYFDTTANTLTDLANDIIEKKIIKGTMLLPPNDYWQNSTDIFGEIATYISSASVSSNVLTLAGTTLIVSLKVGDAMTQNYAASELGKATVTQLY